MLIKNTFKIMFSNFPVTIKSWLYKLLIICLILLMGYGVLSPILDEFINTGMIAHIYDFFASGVFAFNGAVIQSSASEISYDFIQIMNANMSFTWNFIALFLILFVLFPLLMGLSKVAECGVLFGRLSSNSRFEYLTCYFDNFKNGLKFRLFRLLFSIPVLFVCIGLSYLYSLIFVTEATSVLGIILSILSIIVICSAFMTFFLIYEPNLLIKETTPWTALKDSVNNVKRYGFFKVFLMMFATSIVIFLFNAFFIVFTYGISLLITIPISVHFSNIFRMVLCYDCLGMDYYINSKSVCVTKKYYEKNNLDNMKDIL